MMPFITALVLLGTSPNLSGSIDLNSGTILNEPLNPQPSISRNPLFSSSFQLETREVLGTSPNATKFDSLNFSLIGEYNLGGNYLNASGWQVRPFGDYILLSSGGGFYVFTRNDTLRKVKEISGPGYIFDFEVRGNLVYSASGDKGLVIFDLSSIQNPQILSQLDIPYEDPNYNEIFGWGATGIDLKDSFAYVTMRNAGLFVVNISNPNAPRIVGSNNQYLGLMDVIVRDTLAFATNYYNDRTNGFIVYNIANPLSPSLVSTIPELERGMRFVIKDTIAYIPTRWYEVAIFNIADPQNLRRIGSISGVNEAYNVWVEEFGDTLYAFVSHMNELIIFDVTDPTNPFEVTIVGVASASVWIEGRRLYDQGLVGVALYDITYPWNPQLINYYIYMIWPLHLTARDNYAYLYDGVTGYLRILDISDPANITEVSYFADYLDSIPSGVWTAAIGGMFLEGDYVYLIVRGGLPWFCYMAIVKITEPYNPLWVGTAMWRGYAGGNQPYVEDSLAYVPTTLSGQTFLRIINVKDPANIQDVGLLHYGGVALEVIKRDTFLFKATGHFPSMPPWPPLSNDLVIASVARPWLPRVLYTFTTPEQCLGVDYFSDAPYLAVADGHGGVHIIDVTNPATPWITGTFGFNRIIVEDVHIGRNLAFADPGSKFIGVDASDPNAPTLYGYYDLYPLISAKSVTCYDVWSKGDSILLGITGGGLFVFRTGYIGIEEAKVGSLTTRIGLLSNPARNRIQFSLDRNRDYTIKLYDISGRLKKDLKVTGKERLELSTTGLSAGVYILQVCDESHRYSFKKSVIIVE